MKVILLIAGFSCLIHSMFTYFRFIKNNILLLGFGLLAVFWGNFGQSFFISWFGEGIQQSFNLSASQYGLIYSLATLASAFSLVWFGGLIDKVSLPIFLCGICFGLCLACTILYFSTGLWSLVFGFYLLRLCGQGLLPHTGQTIMVKSFVANRGKALGLVSTGIPLGEIILPLCVVWLLTQVTWQEAWAIVGAMTALLFLPFVITLAKVIEKKSSQGREALVKLHEHAASTRKEMLTEPRFWCILPAVLTPAFIVTGIFIQQAALLDAKGWSATWFATSFIVYGGTHWIGSLLGGWIVDLFTGKKMLGVYLVPMILGLGIIGSFDGAWVGPCFMINLGLTLGASGPVVGALWAELYGTTHMGAIRSVVTALVVFSSAISPVAFGLALDNGVSFETLMQLCCAGVACATALAYFGVNFIKMPSR